PTWKWWVCGLLLLATMILYMDRLVLTQQEALIRASFAIESDDRAYGLLDSAFSVAFACGALLAGWIADPWTVWLLYPILLGLWRLLTGRLWFFVGVCCVSSVSCFFRVFSASGPRPWAKKAPHPFLAPAGRPLGMGFLQRGAGIVPIFTRLVLIGRGGASANG